ncbi:MAG: Dabb family protein [Chitinophagaceae bacterium]|nr:Dabb family protein [Chitinophagaceae bacterium]
MIKHSVILSLKENISAAERKSFFEAAAALSNIEGVKKIEILNQVSPKNNYQFGIAMEFDSAEEYSHYNEHPQHQQFIEKYWLNYVEKFLEIDFEAFKG